MKPLKPFLEIFSAKRNNNVSKQLLIKTLTKTLFTSGEMDVG